MGGDFFREGLRWRSFKDELPALPDNGYEASPDFLAAIIQDDKIVNFDRICRCARDDADGNPQWARDGRLINWIPTHWLPISVGRNDL